MSRMKRLLIPAATALAVTAGGLLVSPSAAAAPSCDQASAEYSYVVLYHQRTPEHLVDSELRQKCGTKTAYYPEIGVAVATSRNQDFAEKVGVYRAYSAGKDVAEATSARADLRDVERTTEVSAADDLGAQQWDMRAIQAPEANEVNPGSRSVTVGVIDSGIEPTHPALKGALDPAASAGCLTGAADPTPSSWAPTTSDHGTHVAGTIAGQDTARGFTGVAPGVRLAAVKVVNDEGLIFPESAVCGFMWSARHGFEVTNSSYYVDPGMFYCSKEPGDAAAYEAVRRAVAYSTGKGALNVAAAGNSAFDIPAQTTDPNRPHPVDRSCAILPGGLDGVVTVSAIGYAGTKSSYSNYGRGAIDVTAPGGDRAQLPPPGEGAGCPLSTVVGGGYGTKCGTSMASPHVAGVAALLASTHRHASPRVLTSLLERQADPVPCGPDPTCTGSPSRNSHYGHGRVNALTAVL
ncbi:S8 family peptidase [Amycolatopsis nigrescens]|uniref:S8 family peptidase n=1 Tax=Amycolatopsis nigrescens TaxID=381445 RepID=UPI0003749516|nr:S8 family serine peptidase [Amycolatopsis nigrescens]